MKIVPEATFSRNPNFFISLVQKNFHTNTLATQIASIKFRSTFTLLWDYGFNEDYGNVSFICFQAKMLSRKQAHKNE